MREKKNKEEKRGERMKVREKERKRREKKEVEIGQERENYGTMSPTVTSGLPRPQLP